MADILHHEGGALSGLLCNPPAWITRPSFVYRGRRTRSDPMCRRTHHLTNGGPSSIYHHGYDRLRPLHLGRIQLRKQTLVMDIYADPRISLSSTWMHRCTCRARSARRRSPSARACRSRHREPGDAGMCIASCCWKAALGFVVRSHFPSPNRHPLRGECSRHDRAAEWCVTTTSPGLLAQEGEEAGDGDQPMPMTAGSRGTAEKMAAPIRSAQTIWLYCAGATWLAAQRGWRG